MLYKRRKARLHTRSPVCVRMGSISDAMGSVIEPVRVSPGAQRHNFKVARSWASNCAKLTPRSLRLTDYLADSDGYFQES